MPYCRNCGKQIDASEGQLCEECRHQELVFGEYENAAQETTEVTAVNEEQTFNQQNYNQQTNGYYNQGYTNSYTEAPKQEVKPEPKGNRMDGFGRALASTIVGTFAYIFGLVAYVIALAALEITDSGAVGGSIVCFLLAIAPAIIALINGIRSVKLFNERRKEGAKKPIATLVLGIVGIVSAAIALLFVLITLLLLMTLSMLI